MTCKIAVIAVFKNLKRNKDEGELRKNPEAEETRGGGKAEKHVS